MRVVAVPAIALAGLLVLAGCSGDGGGDSATNAATSAAPGTPSASAAPSSAPASSPAPAASTTAPPATSAAPSSAPAGSAQTKEGAIARYEEYLHAIGREDLDTACVIAAPAAKQAEAMGIGPCKTSLGMMEQMIAPAQKKALQTATIDPAKVDVQGPAKVEIPASAIRTAVTFTSRDLGDSTLEYLNGAWYITD
ncbi:hypothetical protein [Yinghuangia soli]|uniref:Nuclear transport factor 2 family protein n=1 Tax=Yinghuangia soli TaxID=2908204 RepID=A0AA41Q556_9ACTN|nr:hypothetical protein [Yinghuangia soli]MCF2530307.1 hypothetical protein [Yinghuangia soli]